MSDAVNVGGEEPAATVATNSNNGTDASATKKRAPLVDLFHDVGVPLGNLASTGPLMAKLEGLIDSVPSAVSALFSTRELVVTGLHYLNADTDNDGELDEEEVMHILEHLPDDVAESEASELFKQLDVDGSGKVSFEEILLCIASVSFCQDDLLESLYKRSSPETKIPELFHARTLPAQEVSPLAFEQQDNPKDRRTNPRFNRIVSLNHSRVDNDHEADGQRNRVSVVPIYLVDGGWEDMKVTPKTTAKMMCMAMKKVLDFTTDVDFSLYVQDHDGNIIKQIEEDEILVKVQETATRGPFRSGERVSVRMVDVGIELGERVKLFVEKMWKTYALRDGEYLYPEEMNVMVRKLSQENVSKSKCEKIMDSIDKNKDRKLSRNELTQFISNGLLMASAQRKRWEAKSSTHKSISRFFTTCEEMMNGEVKHGVVFGVVNPGIRLLENGVYTVEVHPHPGKKVFIDIAEKNIDRDATIVFRRTIYFKDSKFEEEAKVADGAHRLNFAEYYHRYVDDYYKSSIGQSIDLAALVVSADLLEYQVSGSPAPTKDTLFAYGQGLRPYVSQRVLELFRHHRKEDILGERIKEAMDNIVISPTVPQNPAAKQKWLEQQFVQSCMGWYECYGDTFYNVKFKTYILLGATEDPIVDIETMKTWPVASLGFGYQGVSLLEFKEHEMNRSVHIPFNNLMVWSAMDEGSLFGMWTKQFLYVMNTDIPIELQKTLTLYVKACVEIRDHGKRLAEGRRYEEEELRDIFSKFDCDDSGSLDRDEVHRLLITLGADPFPHEIDQFMNLADTDGSGAIELGEFVKVWNSKVESFYQSSSQNRKASMGDVLLEHYNTSEKHVETHREEAAPDTTGLGEGSDCSDEDLSEDAFSEDGDTSAAATTVKNSAASVELDTTALGNQRASTGSSNGKSNDTENVSNRRRMKKKDAADSNHPVPDHVHRVASDHKLPRPTATATAASAIRNAQVGVGGLERKDCLSEEETKLSDSDSNGATHGCPPASEPERARCPDRRGAKRTPVPSAKSKPGSTQRPKSREVKHAKVREPKGESKAPVPNATPGILTPPREKSQVTALVRDERKSSSPEKASPPFVETKTSPNRVPVQPSEKTVATPSRRTAKATEQGHRSMSRKKKAKSSELSFLGYFGMMGSDEEW